MPKERFDLKRVLLVAALIFAIAIAALDQTVVGTALPTVVGNLGGRSLFSWVFSIYLLASTVAVPLYGKLADLYGRKPVLCVAGGGDISRATGDIARG